MRAITAPAPTPTNAVKSIWILSAGELAGNVDVGFEGVTTVILVVVAVDLALVVGVVVGELAGPEVGAARTQDTPEQVYPTP
jgi:hypothetical protein